MKISMLKKIKIWWYKQTHFEFFSMKRMYLPVAFGALIQALRFRKLYWFSYTNPVVPKGGVFGHSKYMFLKDIPSHNLPQTIFIEKGIEHLEALKILTDSSLGYPLVGKPDDLYRGVGVTKLESDQDLVGLLEEFPEQDILIQEYIHTDKEFAVFYLRYPNEKEGRIVSVIDKLFLELQGDGIHTMSDIIKKHPRASLYAKKILSELGGVDLDTVPMDGEVFYHNFVGSHNKGTIFKNQNHRISKKIHRVFDEISQNLEQFCYGRFDVKADSFKEMEQGSFKVLEVNAGLAEPIHMYDPKTTVHEGYTILKSFWRRMAKIAWQNYKKSREL